MSDLRERIHKMNWEEGDFWRLGDSQLNKIIEMVKADCVEAIRNRYGNDPSIIDIESPIKKDFSEGMREAIKAIQAVGSDK